MWTHLVARSLAPLRPLEGFDACSWLWDRLRRAFPDALECVLMPNGLHLVEESDGVDESRACLTWVLRGFTRRHGRGRRLWEPVPEPTLLPDRLHRRRTSRYIPLNPSRAGLVQDPLEWLWSTYRDIMGATANPWVSPERLARALGRPRHGFECEHHSYVSADPSVAIGGTPPLTFVRAASIASFPLRRIQLAVAAAFRLRSADVFEQCQPRRLFVVLARDQGWPMPAIAGACGMSLQAARRVTAAPAALAAAKLCLNDDRLLVAVSAPNSS